MKTVIFTRHGEAQANKEGLLAGARTDSPLTEDGREHAHERARVLMGRQIDLIVTSPLSRASETASIVAEDIGYKGGIVTEPLFTERDFGSATNMPKAKAFAALDNGTATDVETISEFGKRGQEAIDWLKARPEEHIAVFSHAALGQMIGTLASGGRPEDFLSFPNLSNGGTFEFALK